MSAVIILKVAQESYPKKINMLQLPELCVMHPQAQQMLSVCCCHEGSHVDYTLQPSVQDRHTPAFPPLQ